jgi:murein DD-endopeptidase MepM/ murein hydrolase activator NlpD
MRLRHRRRLRVLVVPVLGVLIGLGPSQDGRSGDLAADRSDTSVSAEVARLYEEAARATALHEQGRQEARIRRAEAEKLERLLASGRAEKAVVQSELGRIARAQYRTGGGLPYTAQLVLAEDPDELMYGRRVAWQAELAVANALGKSQRAERRLAADEEKATTAWQELAAHNARLAEIRKGVETKLEEARWRLQSEADGSAAAGRCAGAVRLAEKPPVSGPKWVAPAEKYELSAGFGSSGERWSSRHTGQDFAVPIGTPVRSIGAGRVHSVSCGGAFGIEVVVRHDNGYYSQYAHLAAVTVDQGQRVVTGKLVGQAGTTGNSTGPHLHLEVRLTPHLGSGVDPARWLRERGVRL